MPHMLLAILALAISLCQISRCLLGDRVAMNVLILSGKLKIGADLSHTPITGKKAYLKMNVNIKYLPNALSTIQNYISLMTNRKGNPH